MTYTSLIQSSEIIITDGAMGTLLLSRLPDYRGPLEMLCVDNPKTVEEIHSLYIEAGALLILTNTFGGNALKLDEFGLRSRTYEINKAAALCARNASNGRALVAGDVSATGRLIDPMGDSYYDEVYASFSEQIRGLVDGGVDLIVIETMTDLNEAKIALLAARALTRLPILCSMSFEEGGKTISGTDIVTGLSTLVGHGADIVGANCSLGPDQLLNAFKPCMNDLKRLGVPLSIWGNAGLPKIVNGKTVFPLSPEEFARQSSRFAELGFTIIGGCCGTTPEHIRALSKELNSFKRIPFNEKKHNPFITSRYSHIDLEAPRDLLRIGERLNPTARKAFAKDLVEGKTSFLYTESKAQSAEGADILDINVGVPNINELDAISKCVRILSNTVRTPLMIDSDNADVIEQALKIYPGCAIVNSINGKRHSVEKVLPVLKKYGCFVVALCLDETGIHREAIKRIIIGDHIVSMLESEGISADRIFIDPLMLAESAEPGSAVETLKVIRHFHEKGIKTSIGLSNISFGLPKRIFINNTFARLAVENGLTAAIINPKTLDISEQNNEENRLSKNFILGHDTNASEYIAHFADQSSPEKAAPAIDELPIDCIKRMLIEGDIDGIAIKVKEAIQTIDPEEIMNSALIAGLEVVGDLYSKGEYFLPQMIASANAMKNGFAVIKPLLSKERASAMGKIVICTVQGDIHDIGKNIVAMMLENNGFEVIDLGKDVPSEVVIEAAKKHDASIIALSSLLTTTMGEMARVKNLMDKNGMKAKLMIGGAVVNDEYAQSIGAHYSRDAVAASNLAKRLVQP